MKKTIPSHIDPYRASDQNISFLGLFSAVNTQRLSSVNVNLIGDAELELHFKRDESGIAVLTGKMSVKIELLCQRCLNPYQQLMQTQFVLGVVDTMEEADVLPKSYEPVFTTDRELIISDLIEDEVLLALPIIPKHPLDQCDIKNRSVVSDADPSFTLRDNDRSHPFDVLNVLKRKTKQ